MSTRANAIATTIAACTVLLAAPAAAIDGEILIDQTRVNAGGITPGDAAGFPATLSRPGRYKLTGNLAVPADVNGIEVTQHNVTIDLNGFTISSNPHETAVFGIFANFPPDLNGLRITNGTITGFESAGIAADHGALAVVENMRLVSNGYGLTIGSNSRVLNSTISSNRFDGVLTSCDGCLIEQNVITGNDGRGAVVANGSMLLGNVIASNAFQGIVGFGGLPSGFGNNTLFGNGNSAGGAQISGVAVQLHPNVCEPACP
jgi:hypothetical protein